MDESRQAKRAQAKVKVRLKSASVGDFVEHDIHNLSSGGMFVKADEPQKVGSLLRLEMQIDDESPLISGVGRVVWIREAAEGKAPVGMGVKFVKMNDENKKLVEAFVEAAGDKVGPFESEPPTGATDDEADDEEAPDEEAATEAAESDEDSAEEEDAEEEEEAAEEEEEEEEEEEAPAEEEEEEEEEEAPAEEEEEEAPAAQEESSAEEEEAPAAQEESSAEEEEAPADEAPEKEIAAAPKKPRPKKKPRNKKRSKSQRKAEARAKKSERNQDKPAPKKAAAEKKKPKPDGKPRELPKVEAQESSNWTMPLAIVLIILIGITAVVMFGNSGEENGSDDTTESTD